MSVLCILTTAAQAITNPPYDLYGYVADATDNPPVNYMKVCEPGRQGEANASYVVLGISFPRTFQAVSGDYEGDLVIPAYIDGLPVRKINEAAFIMCTKLRSVKIPSTVREVGDRAFSDCYSLAKVTFENGVSRIGDSAFSNCVSLTSIRLPKTLSRLGAGCFQGCVSLTDVYFDGNAPRLSIPEAGAKSVMGEGIFRTTGYSERFRVHINRNTYGWISPYEKGVPEKWPVDFGYMQAHETVAEGGGSAGGFGAVTNVVEHWVTNELRTTVHTFSTVTNYVFGIVTNVVEHRVTNELRTTEHTYSTVTNCVFAAVTNTVEHHTTVTNLLRYVPGEGTGPGETYRAKAGTGSDIVMAGAAGCDAVGVPDGMTWDRDTGTLRGRPVLSGTYELLLLSGSGPSTVVMRSQVVVEGFDAVIGYVGTAFRRQGEPFTLFENQKNWPSGLKWNAGTGVLSGVPLKSGDFSRRTVNGEIVGFAIRELPAGVVGTFHGVMGAVNGSSVAEGLPVEVTVSASGKIAAKVVAGGKTVSFSAKSFTGWEADGNGSVFEAELASAAGDILAISVKAVDPADWKSWNMTGVLAAKGTKNSRMPERGWTFSAQRNAFGKAGSAYENREAHAAALAVAGTARYDTEKDSDGVWRLVPGEGTARNAVTVTVKEDGRATLSGRLADGTSVSGSSVIVFSEDVVLLRFCVKGVWVVGSL